MHSPANSSSTETEKRLLTRRREHVLELRVAAGTVALARNRWLSKDRLTHPSERSNYAENSTGNHNEKRSITP